MKTAIVSFYEAFPPVSGAASVTYNVAKFLSCERILIQIGARSATIESSDGVRITTLGAASENRVLKIASLPHRILAITREILHFQPHRVILEGASWAVYHWM